MSVVRREGPWLCKRLAARGPIVARCSALLAERGVRTPVGWYRAATGDVVFPWLEGISGRVLAVAIGARSAHSAEHPWRRIFEQLGPAFAAPIARLHGVESEGLELTPLDPWRLIKGRLRSLQIRAQDDRAVAVGKLAATVCERIARALSSAAGRRAEIMAVPVHGDYHVGQLLFSEPAAEPWLLDLDDCALGSPESDLGNFAAHLLTMDEFAGATIAGADLVEVAGVFVPLYEQRSGRRVNRDLVRLYGAAALVRRALKRSERAGEPDVVVTTLSSAAALI